MKREKWNIHDSHFCYTTEGNVCSDSESDNPDEWIDVHLRTDAGKKLIQKERRRIRQKA